MFLFSAFIRSTSIAVLKPSVTVGAPLSGSSDIKGLAFQLFRNSNTSRTAFVGNPNLRNETIFSLAQ